MRSLDTSVRAHERHLRAYRDAGSERRAAIAAELSETIRDLSRAGVRMRHPNFSEEEVAKEVCRIFYGELMRKRHGR